MQLQKSHCFVIHSFILSACLIYKIRFNAGKPKFMFDIL
jgi:hypothetical protein